MNAEQSSLREPSCSLLDRASLLGLSLPIDLERLAILRGCDYYARPLPPDLPPLPEIPFSNAELAIALISPLMQPAAREIRLAAALLGTLGTDPAEVNALALQAGNVGVVRYIAECGQLYEPENTFWAGLLRLLPKNQNTCQPLPHPSRFIEMTGIDRGKVGLFTRWIRPRQPIAA